MPAGPMSLTWESVTFRFTGSVWSSLKGKLTVPLQKTGFGGSEAVPHTPRAVSCGNLRRAGTEPSCLQSSLSPYLCSVSLDPAPSKPAGCAGGSPRPGFRKLSILNILHAPLFYLPIQHGSNSPGVCRCCGWKLGSFLPDPSLPAVS